MTPYEQPQSINAAQLVALVRAEVQSQQDSPAEPDSVHARQDTPAPRNQARVQPFEKPRFHPTERYALHDLLALHDSDFIDAAYRAVLRRPADPAGRAHYLQSLRNGALSKPEVLGRLRYSKEGRRQGVPVRGLAATFAVQHAYRLPVVGPLIALATAVCRLPRIVRSLQAFEGYQHHRNQLVAATLSTVAATEQRSRENMAQLASDTAATRADLAVLTQQVARLRESVEEPDGTVQRSIASVEKAVEQAALQSDQLRAALASLDAQAHQVRTLAEAQREHKEQHQHLVATTLERIDALRLQADAASQTADAAREQLGSLSMTFQNEREHGQHARERLVQQLAQLQGRADEQGLRMLDSEQRLWRLLDSTAALQADADPSAAAPPASMDGSRMDALYFALEQRFRGTREDIRARLGYYLPMLRDALGTNGSVVDLGCGRGEWLELLHDQGLSATGVDSSDAMVAVCQQRGLNAVHGDAIAFLRALPDDSQAAVSGFHVIEHIGIDALIALLDEARRVLRPGGLLILETPNPENVTVGSCSFWIDPSHRQPIPPVLAQFLAEARGFAAVEIHRVNGGLVPSMLADPAADAAPALLSAVRLLRSAFEAAPDYAVIGRAQ